jgi:uncharacterized membrane protein
LTWLQRYRLRAFLDSSLWIVPVLGVGLALVLAPMLRRLDAATGWTLFGFGPDGARAVLGGLVASVFTFVVFVFSILLVAVQIASASLTPRVIATFLSHRPVRACVGLMAFTFVYGLAVLGRTEDAVPQLPVAVVVASSISSIVAFLYLIDHLGRRLRPVSVLAEMGRRGADVLATIYPDPLAASAVVQTEPAPLSDDAPPRVVTSPTGGVVLAFDIAGLAEVARAADGVIELVPQVGDFVAQGDPLFRIHGGRAALDERQLHQRIALGAERTIEQDPAFPFRIIVDIAAKALSPAINDPTTAVLALDQLHHLLRNAGIRNLDTGRTCDGAGRPRLVYNTPDWEAFVDLALTEIRHYGAGSIQVARRLRALLLDLIGTLPAERHPPLRAELGRLQRSLKTAFSDPEDRIRAERGDSQGLGGHDQAVPAGQEARG